MDAIKDTISRASKYKRLYMKNEEAVKQQLFLPLLEALGWDTKNPSEVVPEDKTEMGRADYALKIRGKTIAYVEVKKLEINIFTNKKPLQQLGSYCYARGVRYGILTNGVQWLLMKAYEEGKDINERILFQINLEEEELELVLHKMTLLDKNRLPYAEEILMLLKSLKSILESLESKGIPRETAIKFASLDLSESESSKTIPVKLPESAILIENVSDPTYKKVVESYVYWNDKWIPLSQNPPSWKNTVAEYAKFLVSSGLALPEFPPYISTNKQLLRKYDVPGKTSIKVGKWYVYVWLEAKESLQILKKLWESSGVPLAVVLTDAPRRGSRK
ncbi:hypothetical protein E3E23_04795 [Thermococcus sp. CX2]|nr:hypothetical protein [Thermococcus sp. CX2]